MNRFWSPLLAQRHPGPGRALLHPCTLLALSTLILNDHVIKRSWPGLISGKLSDFAGVLLLPLFVHAWLELAWAWRQRPLGIAAGDRALLVCVLTCSLAFALPEIWPPAEVAYRSGLGALRYPFKLLWALTHGRAAPPFVPVQATADATDLLALPMALVALRVGRRAPSTLTGRTAPA